MDKDRNKFDNLVEKEAYKLVSRIKTHAQSFVHMYARKARIQVDDALLERLGEVFGAGMEDGFQSQIDFFKKEVDKGLNNYLETTNAIPLTAQKKTKTGT